MQSFSRDKLGQVRRIVEANLKITSEGFYYQLIVETSASNQYNVIVYQKPEDNYTEIISYEQINFQYSLAKD